jgi:peptidoglycan/LPS O-acetylase OafA/YrhL
MTIDRNATRLSIPDLRGSSAATHLDMMRGLAAVAVLVSHLRHLFLVDYSMLSSNRRGPALALIYFLTALGHQAVIIFFVLSGFLIAGSVIKAALDGSWSWQLYLINRTSRLYVVLIPALFLGLSLDRIGIALGGGIYSGHLHNHVIDFSVIQRSGWLDLVGNALFLQDIWVRPFGSNAALWSLSYEFWYYLIFPFLVLAIFAERSVTRWSNAGAAALIFVFVGKPITLYFVIWLTGAAINLLPQIPVGRGRLACTLAGACFVFSLVVGRVVKDAPTFEADLFLGLAASGLIYAMLANRRRHECAGLYLRTARGLARFSYTLYLVHLPLLVLVAACLNESRWQPGVLSLAGVVLIGGGALCYASVVARLTEFHTGALRERLTALVSSLQERALPARERSINQRPL